MRDHVAKLWPLFVSALAATYTFGLGNIVAPLLGRSLGVPTALVTLVIGVFGAAYAAGLIISGRLGDRHGRRRVWRLGLALLVVTSVAVAVAPGFWLLLAARFAQGVAFALLTPQILATIQATTAGPERASAISLFAASSGAGTAVGQLVGGVLLSLAPLSIGWRVALGSTAVVALVALAGGRGVAETRSPARSGLDFGGTVILAAALLALLFGLSLGGTNHWPWWCLALIVAGLVGFWLFWRQQSRRERDGRSTLTPPTVVRLPPIWLGMVLGLMFFAGFGGFMFAYAVMSQQGERLSPLWTGIGMVPFVGGFVVFSLLVPRITARLGARTMEVAAVGQAAGIVLTALAVLLASPLHGVAWLATIVLPATLMTSAQAVQFGPLISTIVAEVPHEVAGLSGGLIATVQQAALGLGAATIGGMFVGLAGSIGWPRAFAVALGAQLVTSVLFLLAARRLRRTPPVAAADRLAS